ncbi:ArgE/DapE family deacylase [Weissella coleopterorum]|uniref:Probable succinyl-diaminopimelate desuccinylase n=1 Tax=Weissella coleopterorum TaxID=2714949 RepID=A0A6G8AYD8_9LACO|nr:ArgE/DapE family deacylase [Weissella coleopterorum]QIL50016.1 ArgE/DapE family deacylase [Weissella coleopterorum]
MVLLNDAARIDILQKLVAIPSVNDHELDVANYLAELLAQYDIKAKIMTLGKNRANLMAEIGTGSPVLAVTGHMDVVDPGDLKAWESDPFILTQKDGKLYGRGASDMKGGLAALIISMIEMKTQNKPAHGTIRLLATLGEEVGEEGSHHFFENGDMQDVDALLVAEPSGYQIAYAQKGSIDLKLTSKGAAAHSSMPNLGFNALDPLISILNVVNEQFRANEIPVSAVLGNVTVNTDVLTGGVQVNSLPESAEALINIRTIPEFDGRAVINKFDSIVKNELQKYNLNYDQNMAKLLPGALKHANVSYEVMMDEPAVISSKENQLIKLAQTIGEQFAGQKIPVLASPGITDASNLMREKDTKVPFIVFGPGNTTSHMANEYVDQSMYLDFIEIYIQLFEQFLAN